MKQREFETVEKWLEMMSDGQPVGIMTVTMAAHVTGYAVSTIKTQLRQPDNHRMRIVIAGEVHVSVEYIQDWLDAWQTEANKIRRKIERVAARRQKIFYGELMEAFGMNYRNGGDRTKIGYILGYISKQTFQEQGILLSAIVHRKGPEPTTPGDGYFGLMEVLVEELEDFPFDTDSDYDEQLAEHMEAVWNFYEGQRDNQVA